MHANELNMRESVHSDEEESLQQMLERCNRNTSSLEGMQLEGGSITSVMANMSENTYTKMTKQEESLPKNNGEAISQADRHSMHGQSQGAPPFYRSQSTGSMAVAHDLKACTFGSYMLRPTQRNIGKTKKTITDDNNSLISVKDKIKHFENEASKRMEDPVYSLSFKLFQAYNERDQLKKLVESLQGEVLILKTETEYSNDTRHLKQLYDDMFQEEYGSDSGVEGGPDLLYLKSMSDSLRSACFFYHLISFITLVFAFTASTPFIF